MPYPAMENTATKIILIAQKARENTSLRFISLMHHLNPEYLLACFEDLKRKRAPGIDGRTMESYAPEEIKTLLNQTVVKIKSKEYQPQPVRRTYIEKPGTSQKRPLGLPTVIDKVIQTALKNILEAIYESNFLDCSYGYRPQRDAHQALKAVNHMIMQKKINWILEADIKGFFDNLDHHWMMECLSQRISDPNFKSLIYKFLKSGVLEKNLYQPTEQGTPQGGIVSPVLANIYLHYVLDLWFEKSAQKEIQGDVQLIRYADDFLIGFQHKAQAERFLQKLKERLKKFKLELAPDKTHIIEFGRFAKENCAKREEKTKTFDFLGFTHYCTITQDGRFKLGIKTSSKRMKRSLTSMNLWLKTIRNRLKLQQIWGLLRSKLQGHYNYYGISGNFESINQYYYRTIRLTHKWMNRRSQKKSFNWTNFHRYLEKYLLPRPKLMFQIYNTW
jgi:group II intron reverse transcriptase/maturase